MFFFSGGSTGERWGDRGTQAANIFLAQTAVGRIKEIVFDADINPPLKAFGTSLTRIRARLGGLPHLEMFRWQNMTLAERVTRSGRSGNTTGRFKPPTM